MDKPQNVFNSRFYDSVKLHPSQSNQLILERQQEKKKHFTELTRYYPIITKSNPAYLLDGVNYDLIEFELPLKEFKLPIKIILGDEFPIERPLIYTKLIYQSKLINDKTGEITGKFKWSQSIQLAQYFEILKNELLLEEIKKLPEILQIERILNTDQRVLYNGISNCNLEQLFPGVDPQGYGQLINNTDFSENIIQLPEYPVLALYILDLIEQNENATRFINQKQNELFQQKNSAIQLSNLFEIQKGQLAHKIQQCDMIKERFNQTKILNFLDSLITKVNQESEQLMNNRQIPFDKQMNTYLELRKTYHSLTLKMDQYKQALIREDQNAGK